jgi:hypothetical protein
MRTWRDAGRVTGQRAERETELAVTLWQDPLWRHVLCRAVIHYLEANRQGRDAPSFLAVKRLSYSRGRSARGPDYSGLVRTVAFKDAAALNIRSC